MKLGSFIQFYLKPRPKITLSSIPIGFLLDIAIISDDFAAVKKVSLKSLDDDPDDPLQRMLKKRKNIASFAQL